MKVIVIGGCGYVGSQLVKDLLNKGYKVKVIDSLWFGNFLKKHKNLIVIKKDIRKLKIIDFKGYKAVFHLANVANDPAVELNQSMSFEINVLATKQILELCISAKIKKFIFSSSGSVYGIKKEKKVTENLSLIPISIYNKTKMIAERVILSYKEYINVMIVRPATVCGISSRMRLDVSVNLLTTQALKNAKIQVLGGKQIRPNIHIKDLSSLFIFLFENQKIKFGIFNAGFENISILNLAKKIQKKIKTKIIIKKSNDNRSYRLDSSKIVKLGFKPKYDVNKAIDELIEYNNYGKLKNNLNCYNVKWMIKNNIK